MLTKSDEERGVSYLSYWVENATNKSLSQVNSLKVSFICVNFFKPAQKEEIPHSKFKENNGYRNSKDKHLKKLRFHFSSIMTTYV